MTERSTRPLLKVSALVARLDAGLAVSAEEIAFLMAWTARQVRDVTTRIDTIKTVARFKS
jgi:hypothetical protein